MGEIQTIRVGIIGTGNIGSSMAALLTGNGFAVTALAEDEAELERGREITRGIFATLAGRNLVNAENIAACQGRLTYTTRYQDLAEVELLFECAFEDLEIKYAVYEQVRAHCKGLQALASTSSALAPDDLAKGFPQAADRLMVAHPFNPPHIVPFVELVRGAGTGDAAVQLVYNVLEACGRKVCVMRKAAPGFIANRLQHALLREAFYMVEQGMVDARDIDKALQFSFMPRYTAVGLFEHQDAFGLDMVRNVQNYLFPHLCADQSAPAFVTERVERGEVGQRSGQGTYPWDGESIADFQARAAEPYWKYFNWTLPD